MIDLIELRDLIDRYYKHRASTHTELALTCADMLVNRIRPLLAPTNTLEVHHVASRSLWRHAKSGDLDNYLTQGVLRGMAEQIIRRGDIFETIRFQNLDALGNSTDVPKKMVRHEASLSVFVLPTKE